MSKFNEVSDKFDHLNKNLERISTTNSILNYELGKKAFLSLGKGNYKNWIKSLLPNTRIILEPKIIGHSMSIYYEKGKLKKAINKNGEDITELAKSIKNIPKSICIQRCIQISGKLYDINKKLRLDQNTLTYDDKKNIYENKRFKFCVFYIFNCNLNHYKSLQELKALDFEVPQSMFTKFVADIEIYRHCWDTGKLFKMYPTNGIVLKINSKKFQKQLGANNESVNWAYVIE